MLDKSNTNKRAEHAHSLGSALVRALDVLRQIIGEESGLLHGDTFAIERRDLRAPLLDQLQRLAAASLGTREHPFRVRSSTGLLIAGDTHLLNTNTPRTVVRASRLMFTGAVRMRAGLSLSIRCLCMADALRL
jgi:hypothetical protein